MVAEDRPILRHCAPVAAGGAATRAHVAQQAEHFLGKEEVSGSSPDVGSSTVRVGAALRRASSRVDPNVVLPLAELAPLLRLSPPWSVTSGSAPPALPAGLDDRPAVVRDQRRHRVPRQRVRLERAALPHLVPDRGLRRGPLPGPRDGLPPQPHPLRLLRFALVRPGRPLQLPDRGQVRPRGRPHRPGGHGRGWHLLRVRRAPDGRDAAATVAGSGTSPRRSSSWHR